MEGKIIIQGKIMIQGKIGREDHIYWIAQTGRQGGMCSQRRIPVPLKEEMSIEDMGGKSYKKPYIFPLYSLSAHAIESRITEVCSDCKSSIRL